MNGMYIKVIQMNLKCLKKIVHVGCRNAMNDTFRPTWPSSDCKVSRNTSFLNI